MSDNIINDEFPADAPEWARVLNQRLVNIESIHAKILAVVEELKPEVLGVVESLKSNPMFKMLLGGKK